MNIAVMILGMALINLVIRWPVYLFANHFRFPPIIERALATGVGAGPSPFSSTGMGVAVSGSAIWAISSGTGVDRRGSAGAASRLLNSPGV